MKVGQIDVAENLGKLPYEVFLKHWDYLKKSINDTPENVFVKLGGKLPKK